MGHRDAARSEVHEHRIYFVLNEATAPACDWHALLKHWKHGNESSTRKIPPKKKRQNQGRATAHETYRGAAGKSVYTHRADLTPAGDELDAGAAPRKAGAPTGTKECTAGCSAPADRPAAPQAEAAKRVPTRSPTPGRPPPCPHPFARKPRPAAGG